MSGCLVTLKSDSLVLIPIWMYSKLKYEQDVEQLIPGKQLHGLSFVI